MVKQKIIVSERDNLAALFENDRAAEFIINRGDMLLGDVYLAQVENILPSIDAAFVHVGGDKMGFLHSSDVKGRGPLESRLKPKQNMVVQVIKEPTGHKGPRVTTEISLPGRFIVLMPDSKGISISRKIASQEERSRLKAIVSVLKPSGVGVIIRTEGEGQKESDLKEDFETLMERWQTIVAAADTATPPALLFRDQDLLYRVIREMVTDDTEEIVVDTTFGYQRAQQLLQNWNLDKNIKATLYSGKQSIIMGCGVEREIKLALQTKVPLPSGGYLYIQPTEALTVVDVNSGRFTSLKSQAETIRLTNLESCKEIARQLRLRNIGGMMIIDFIDMESRADQLAILECFENELARDKGKPQMGQLSDLGLVEMTRDRQGQALSEIFMKKEPAELMQRVMENFNWAPPNVDEEVRHSGPARRNLPIKSGSQISKNVSRGSGNRVQRFNPDGGSKQQSDIKSDHKADSDKTVKDYLKPGSALENKPEENGQSKGPAQGFRVVGEMLQEKLLQEFGVNYAHSLQFGVTPSRANNTLARINSKSTDVMTLVRDIQTAEAAPIRTSNGFAVVPPPGSNVRKDAPSVTNKSSNVPAPRALQSEALPVNTGFAGSISSVLSRLSGGAFPSFEVKEAQGQNATPQEGGNTVNNTHDVEDADDDDKPKKRRGRPPKDSHEDDDLSEVNTQPVMVGGGTSEAEPENSNTDDDDKPKKRRGRPPKTKS